MGGLISRQHGLRFWCRTEALRNLHRWVRDGWGGLLSRRCRRWCWCRTEALRDAHRRPTVIEDALYLFFQALLVFGLSEHLTDVDTVGLGELASGLPGSLFVEDPLHRLEYVAAIFRRGQIGQRSILVYQGDNLRHLGFHGLFGVLNLFDLFVALVGQTGQIVLKA